MSEQTAETATQTPVSETDVHESADKPIFFANTFSKLVKKNVGPKTRTTPAARRLILKIAEAETGRLAKLSYAVAKHARGASKKKNVDESKKPSIVRCMQSDLDVVMSVLNGTEC